MRCQPCSDTGSCVGCWKPNLHVGSFCKQNQPKKSQLKVVPLLQGRLPASSSAAKHRGLHQRKAWAQCGPHISLATCEGTCGGFGLRYPHLERQRCTVTTCPQRRTAGQIGNSVEFHLVPHLGLCHEDREPGQAQTAADQTKPRHRESAHNRPHRSS